MYKEYVLHNGRAKEVHGKFGAMIMFKDNGRICSALANGLPFCDAQGNPLDADTQSALRGDVILPTIDGKSAPQPVTVKIGNNNPLPQLQSTPSLFQQREYDRGRMEEGREELLPTAEEGKEHSPASHTTFNINTINSDEDIRKAAASISGLGFKTLTTIVENRPVDGYVSIDHIKEVNGGNIPRNLKWSSMEDYITFS